MKLILAVLVGILSLIFIVQNRDQVTIVFITGHFVTYKWVVIVVSLVFGLILGWVLRSAGARRRRLR
jgi:uncharacterized integral membrane protein